LWVPIALPDEDFSKLTYNANFFTKFSSRALFGTIINIFSLNVFSAFLLLKVLNFIWLFLVIQYIAKETKFFCYDNFKSYIIIFSIGFLFAFNTNIFINNVFPLPDPLAHMLLILSIFFLFSEKNTNGHSYLNILAIICSFSAVLTHEKSLFDISIIAIWLFYKKGFKKTASYCLPLVVLSVVFIFLAPASNQSIKGSPVGYLQRLMIGNSIEYLSERSFNFLGILFAGGFLWPVFFMCVGTFINDGLRLGKKQGIYRFIYSVVLCLLCLLPLLIAYDTNRLVALIWLPTVFLIVETNFMLKITESLRTKIIFSLYIILQAFIPPVFVYLHGAIPLNCYATKSVNFIERLQKDLNLPKYTLLRNHHINAVPDVVDCYPIHLFRNEGMKPFSKDARAYSNWGAVYIKKRMYDKAISECKKAIALDPNYEKAYFNLGSAYGNKNMLNEAIANFEQAITINPRYAKAHYNLALAYYFEENYKLSIKHLDRAKELGASINLKLVEQLKAYR
jgi:hypothetical protein